MTDANSSEIEKVRDIVMNDPRYTAARAEMASQVRAYDRSIIDDPAISDDDYNLMSAEFGVKQVRELFRSVWAPIEREHTETLRRQSAEAKHDVPKVCGRGPLRRTPPTHLRRTAD